SCRSRGDNDPRLHEPAEHDAVPCKPALLPQRARAPPALGPRRPTEARLGRRDHIVRMRDAKNRGCSVSAFLIFNGCADLRGAAGAYLEERGTWGKHGFPHEARREEAEAA